MTEVHEGVLQDMADGKTVPTQQGMWQVRWMAQEILRLRNAMRCISLGAQNSMTSKEDLGRDARKALQPEEMSRPRRMRAFNCNLIGCEHKEEHEEMGTCAAHGCRPIEAENRRRIIEESGTVDYQIRCDRDGHIQLGFYDSTGEWWDLYQAVGLVGFMGFAYADGKLYAEPCRMVNGMLVLPLAARFRKGTR